MVYSLQIELSLVLFILLCPMDFYELLLPGTGEGWNAGRVMER